MWNETKWTDRWCLRMRSTFIFFIFVEIYLCVYQVFIWQRVLWDQRWEYRFLLSVFAIPRWKCWTLFMIIILKQSDLCSRNIIPFFFLVCYRWIYKYIAHTWFRCKNVQRNWFYIIIFYARVTNRIIVTVCFYCVFGV